MTRPGDSREELRRTYDYICPHHEGMWNDQGRSQQFQTYFSQLARSLSADQVLELGRARLNLQLDDRTGTLGGISLIDTSRGRCSMPDANAVFFWGE